MDILEVFNFRLFITIESICKDTDDIYVITVDTGDSSEGPFRPVSLTTSSPLNSGPFLPEVPLN